MKTQELTNYSSFREDDERMDEYIGMGLDEFTGNYVTKVSAFNKACVIKRADSGSVYSSGSCFVSSQQELSNAVEKKEGLTINLGFGSLGHHKTTIQRTTVSKKSLNLLIVTERLASTKLLDITNKTQKDCYSEDATQWIAGNQKVDFYTNFGSNYISKATTGYFMHILVVFKCSSEEEVESKKKELSAALKTDDGSGSAKFGSNKNFNAFCAKNDLFVYESHNIPPELIGETKGYTNEKEKLVGLLALNDKIETFGPQNASVMDYEASVYPFTQHLFGDFNNVEMELLGLKQEMESSREELNTIVEYKNRPSIYEDVPDLEERKVFHTARLDQAQTLVQYLSANPWGNNAAIADLRKKIAVKAPDKLLLRMAAINCVTSNYSAYLNIPGMGKVIVGTTDAAVADSLNSVFGGQVLINLKQLGIVLNNPVKASDLSIHYDVTYFSAEKKGKTVFGHSLKGSNGSIVNSFFNDENIAYVSRVSVSLTGTLAGNYIIHLSGINYYGIFTSEGDATKPAAIDASPEAMKGIVGIAVYLTPKKR